MFTGIIEKLGEIHTVCIKDSSLVFSVKINGLNLYNDGLILYSKQGIYKFSCSLNLKFFPFDTQMCKMKF